MSLWRSQDPEQWEAQLAGYHAAVAGLGRTSKEGRPLAELDKWFHDDLPETIRASASLTQEQLVKLVDWKLTRGKWRPRLLGFAKDQPEAAVESASQAAFKALAPHRGGEAPPEAIKRALDALCVLKGVGPATASAALEAFDPSIPFLSDEAQQAALGAKDYTVKAVQQLTAVLRGKAQQLSKSGGRQWTAKEVEMCLFVSAVGGSTAGGAGQASGSKQGAGGKRKSSGTKGDATPATAAGVEGSTSGSNKRR